MGTSSNQLLIIGENDLTGGCVRLNRNFQLIQSQISTLKSSASTSAATSSILSLIFVGGNGFQGSLYSASLVATGGAAPYTYAIAGALPPGLSFNGVTGNLTGTPTATGTYTMTGQVTDASGTMTTVPISILISASGAAPTVIFATTLSAPTTVINVTAPSGLETLLIVIITQSSGGGNQITWGSMFVPAPSVNINLDGNAPTRFMFAAIGGNWSVTSIMT